MKLSDPSSLELDLDRDLPTTADDVLALRRAKSLAPLDLEGYLHFLAQLPAPAIQRPRSKRSTEADEPFELPPL